MVEAIVSGRVKAKKTKVFSLQGLDLPPTCIPWDNISRMDLRNIFETVISVEKTKHILLVPDDESDADKLNYLAGRKFDQVNKMAELGTLIAHVDGGVPNIRISIPQINEYYMGQLIYFFELSCAVSGYILGVNPFDQPGVEAYKKNMFALLGKPGFEEETKAIKKRIEHE